MDITMINAKTHAQTEQNDICLIYQVPVKDNSLHALKGFIAVKGNREEIHSMKFENRAKPMKREIGREIDREIGEGSATWAKACRKQLDNFFAGKTVDFNLPLAPQGTAFQQKVWQTLQTIPYGEVWTYQQLAKKLGNPNAVRAVASANAKNPVYIAIPCHRVIGSDKALRGYAGGLPRKAALLALEGQTLGDDLGNQKTKVLT